MSLAKNLSSHFRRAAPALLVLGILFGLFILGAQPFAADLIGSPLDHLLHFLVFAVLAIAVGIVTGQRGWRMVLLAVAAALLIGLLDEWHQVFLPGRNPGWYDLAMDALGSLSGASLLAVARRRDVRPPGVASPPDDEPVRVR